MRYQLLFYYMYEIFHGMKWYEIFDEKFTLFSVNVSLSFQTADLTLKESPATLTLVSRRCTRRLGTFLSWCLTLIITFTKLFQKVWWWYYTMITTTGTRMWRRGANLEGDVANFIETEQLVEIDGLRSSFLQVFLVSCWSLPK